MLKIIYISINFIALQLSSPSGFKLEEVISSYNESPFLAFNLIKVDEKIFLSTDKGLFQLKENKLNLVNPKIKRWARYNIKEKKTVESFASKLLESDELNYSLTHNDFHYQILDQKLVIYTKTLFRKKLDKKSVRAISKDFIATYSGIFNSKLKLMEDFPSYSSGKIRQLNGQTFVLYDGMFVASNDTLKYYSSVIGEIRINKKSIGYGSDIVALGNTNYLILTNKGLWKTDLKNIELIDSSKTNDRSSTLKIIHKYPKDGRILYLLDNKLKVINNDLNHETLIDFKEPIIDITIEKNSNDIYYISASEIGLIRNTRTSQIIKNTSAYHNILPLNNSLVLTSDNGMYKLNLKNLEEFKILNEEFNKYSLEKIGDSIYAGSVSGLYSVSIDDFYKLKTTNKQKNKNINTKSFIYYILFTSILIIIFLSYKLIQKNNKTVVQEKLTKELIKEYIRRNLNLVTTELIKENFKISYRKLCKILNETPGKVIENERKYILNLKSNKYKPLKDLSNITGYSEEYIRKIQKNTN